MAVFIEDEAFLGTEKKYLIKIESSGFDMETDDFEVLLKRGGNTLTIRKEDMVVEPYTVIVDNVEVTKKNYYICFNTADLGPGVVSMTVTAHVPDTDFPDGIRDEVDKFNFLRIKSV